MSLRQVRVRSVDHVPWGSLQMASSVWVGDHLYTEACGIELIN